MYFTRKSIQLLSALSLTLALTTLHADTSFIAYQGVAFDNDSAVASTPISLQFTIRDSNSSVIYQERQKDVLTTNKGFFSHQIGSGSPSGTLYSAITWADGYKLQVEVDYNNGTVYTDLGIQEFSSSVYALKSKLADALTSSVTIGGVAFDGSVNINLPGVNVAGTQSTTGNAATATALAANPTDCAAGEFATTIAADGNLTCATPAYIADTDTVYTHPTTAGNKHIPSAGAAGQFLKYSSSGTATWATPSYTTDTDTRNTVNNTLTSTSTTQSLSAKQGKALNDILDSATNTNTASKIVKRDVNGNFSAGTITATLSGTATTALSANYPYVETDETTNAWRYLTFVDSSSAAYQRLNLDSTLKYNPSTDSLYATKFFGDLTGDVTGTASGNLPLTGGTMTGGLLVSSSALTDPSGLGYNFMVESQNTIGHTTYSSTRTFSIIGQERIGSPVFCAYSDKRIKTDILPLVNSLEIIKKLQPSSYTKIDKVRNGDAIHYGFIAQELEQVIPEAVIITDGEVPILKKFDEVDFEDGFEYTIMITNDDNNVTHQTYNSSLVKPEGNIVVLYKKVNDFRTIDYNAVFTHAVAAIQEQQKMIETLQETLKTMKLRLDTIEQSK